MFAARSSRPRRQPLSPLLLLLRANLRRASGYGTIETGALYTPEYRLYICGPRGPISAFHDIPLYAGSGCAECRMVVEIPRWTNAKMEISTQLALNPIAQDTKAGRPRFVDNVFPHHGYIWNYGALPQTWEDPAHVDASTGAGGDNDPVDVCEIGARVHTRGAVLRVKPLGLLGLIDDGETDWKLIVIDAEDPLAPQLEDIGDVEAKMPGLLAATRQWFRDYKKPQGKPANRFAFGGDFKDKAFALGVIGETHEQWRRLVAAGGNGDIACDAVTAGAAAGRLSQADAAELVPAAGADAPAASQPENVQKWHFL